MTLDRNRGVIGHTLFSSLPDLLREGDLVVVNRSRVLPARLLGQTKGGGRAEVLYLFPEPSRPQHFRALVRPGRKLKSGAVVALDRDARCVVVEVHQDGARTMRFEGSTDILDALQQLGRLPLPPYIDRAEGPLDRERYQTIYAKEPGSIAAPTAGLHFTEALLGRLRAKGVIVSEIMLHVGPGTFARVDAEEVADHRVQPEKLFVPEETAEAYAAARERGQRVIAVGTTTVRTLESVARHGRLKAGHGETNLVLSPGHRFQAVDALVTNFHLPRSSLLFLVAAFAGLEVILSTYAEAIRTEYRFYSYGDAMFIY